MNICLFGGTFNPIHNGHIAMINCVLNNLNIDKLYVIPAGNSYFKKDVLSKEDRAQMVKLALAELNDSRVIYSDIEINREGPSYSVDTVFEFRQKNLDSNIYFLIGEDTVYNISKWKDAEKLLDGLNLVVLRRKCTIDEDFVSSVENLENRYNASVNIIEFNYNISSTDIRNMVRNNNDDVNNYISPLVLDYIKLNNIYCD